MRLLVLANVVPFPPHGGIQLRIYHLLRRVADRHEVILACHSWGPEDDANAEALARTGIRVMTGRVRADRSLRNAFRALRFAAGGRPPELGYYRSPPLWRSLYTLLRSDPFDVVQIEETLLTPYLALLPPRSRAKALLTFHNLHFVQSARVAALEPDARRRAWRRMNARWMGRYEPRVAGSFARSITVSASDRAALLARRPGLAVDVVPNGVDTRLLRGSPVAGDEPRLVFVGSMAYEPTEDGAIWLVREILPRLRARRPDLEAWLVGRNPTARVRALAGDGVFVTGEVPDVAPYYERASVVVVPLRAGSGSRLKVLEAMAMERPVVATTIGAEGLDVVDGEHLLLAETPSDLAAAVERVLDDAALRRSLTTAARRLVEERYDWDVVAAKQLRIYDDVVATG